MSTDPADLKNYYFIFVSDSRGYGFCDHFREQINTSKNEIAEAVIGGASIRRLYQELRSRTRDARFRRPSYKIVVILQGGICSLTTKSFDKPTDRQEVPKQDIYYNPSAREQNLKKLKDTYEEVTWYCNNWGFLLLITSVLPADLLKAEDHLSMRGVLSETSFSREEKTQQQANLNKDLEELNLFIRDACNGDNKCYANINTCIQKRSKKKHHKTYKRIIKVDVDSLTDGVHLDPEHSRLVFENIVKSVVCLCNKALQTPKAGKKTEPNNSEEERDHKRPKPSTSSQ